MCHIMFFGKDMEGVRGLLFVEHFYLKRPPLKNVKKLFFLRIHVKIGCITTKLIGFSLLMQTIDWELIEIRVVFGSFNIFQQFFENNSKNPSFFIKDILNQENIFIFLGNCSSIQFFIQVRLVCYKIFLGKGDFPRKTQFKTSFSLFDSLENNNFVQIYIFVTNNNKDINDCNIILENVIKEMCQLKTKNKYYVVFL